MVEPATNATVSIGAKALWRLRLRAELPRYLVQAAAAFGLLASARYAIDPPTPARARSAQRPAAPVDRGAEGFAVLFVRRYLTWEAADPEAHRVALAPYMSAEMEPEAGFQPPSGGSQRVAWTQVVQASPDVDGGGTFTIAAQTDASGLVYLSVGVARVAGALALSGYPAFVGPPATATASVSAPLSEVHDASLAVVVTRALRNYLAGAGSDLAADLAPGVSVALPSRALALEALSSLEWGQGRRSVVAVVHAHDQAGGRYALGYRLAVAQQGGRWQVGAIEVAPGR